MSTEQNSELSNYFVMQSIVSLTGIMSTHLGTLISTQLNVC